MPIYQNSNQESTPGLMPSMVMGFWPGLHTRQGIPPAEEVPSSSQGLHLILWTHLWKIWTWWHGFAVVIRVLGRQRQADPLKWKPASPLSWWDPGQWEILTQSKMMVVTPEDNAESCPLPPLLVHTCTLIHMLTYTLTHTHIHMLTHSHMHMRAHTLRIVFMYFRRAMWM